MKSNIQQDTITNSHMNGHMKIKNISKIKKGLIFFFILFWVSLIVWSIDWFYTLSAIGISATLVGFFAWGAYIMISLYKKRKFSQKTKNKNLSRPNFKHDINRHNIPSGVVRLDSDEDLKIAQQQAECWAEHIKHLTEPSLMNQNMGLPWFLLISDEDEPLNQIESKCKPVVQESDSPRYSQDWLSSDALLVKLMVEEAEFDLFLEATKTCSPSGILVVWSIESLAKSELDLSAKVDQLILSIHRIHSKLGWICPVSVIFKGMEKLIGFEAWIKLLPHEWLSQPLGVHYISQGTQCLSLAEKLTEACFLRMHLEPDIALRAASLSFVIKFTRYLKTIESTLNGTLARNYPTHQAGEQPAVDLFFTGASHQDSKILFSGKLLKTIVLSNQKNPFVKHKSTIHKELRLAIWMRLVSLVFAGTLMFSVYNQWHSLSIQLDHLNEYLAGDGYDTYLDEDISKEESRLIKALQIASSNHQLVTILSYFKFDRYLQNAQAKMMKDVGEGFALHFREDIETKLRHIAYQFEYLEEDEKNSIREEYYSILRAYLMISGRVNYDDVFMAKLFQEWLYQQDFIDNENHRSENDLLSIHALKYWIEYKASAEQGDLELDKKLVQLAQSHFNQNFDVSYLYDSLKTELMSQLPEADILSELDVHGSKWIEPSIKLSTFYTAKVYEKIVLPKMKEMISPGRRQDPVLTDTEDNNELTIDGMAIDDMVEVNPELELAQLQHQYFEEFAKAWLDYLRGVKVKHFLDLENASTALLAFSKEDGPFMALLVQAQKNIPQDKLRLMSSVFEEKAQNSKLKHIVKMADKLKESISYSETANENEEQTSKLPNSPKSLFESYARQLDKLLFKHQELKANPMGSYLASIAELQQEIEHIAVSPNSDKEAKYYAAKLLNHTGSSSALYKLSVLSDTLIKDMPDPDIQFALGAYMHSAIHESWRLLLRMARNDLQSQWSQFYRLYETQLAPYFPFNKSGKDIEPSQLSSFFAPQDSHLSLFMEQIEPFLDLKDMHWSPKIWHGLGLELDEQFTFYLKQAFDIAGALFNAKSGKSEFSFSVMPVANPNMKESVLEWSEQQLKYRNEPPEWHSLHWSLETSTQIPGMSRLTALSGHSTLFEKREEGTWSFLRLLGKAKITSYAEGYLVRFTFDEQSAQIIQNRHYQNKSSDKDIKKVGPAKLEAAYKIKVPKNDVLFEFLVQNRFKLSPSIAEE